MSIAIAIVTSFAVVCTALCIWAMRGPPEDKAGQELAAIFATAAFVGIAIDEILVLIAIAIAARTVAP